MIATAAIPLQTENIFGQNQTNVNQQVINFTKLVEEQFTLDRLGLGFSLPDLQVLYESPTTLVLIGEGPQFNSLGQVIDNAKQTGYNIDSVTAITESARPVGGTVRLTDIYTVFLSRE